MGERGREPGKISSPSDTSSHWPIKVRNGGFTDMTSVIRSEALTSLFRTSVSIFSDFLAFLFLSGFCTVLVFFLSSFSLLVGSLHLGLWLVSRMSPDHGECAQSLFITTFRFVLFFFELTRKSGPSYQEKSQLSRASSNILNYPELSVETIYGGGGC